MISYLNGALEVYWNWQKEEERLKSLEGLQPEGRELLKAKYDFLNKGVCRVGINPSISEKLALHILEGILTKLEKQIYPNRYLRGAHWLKNILIDRPNYTRNFLKLKAENMQQVETLLLSKGLDQYFGKLEQYLDYERNEVHIDYRANLNENLTMTFEAKMVKGTDGGYYLDSIDVGSKHLDHPEKNRYFDFDTDYNIDVIKATNLLMGRAVLNGPSGVNHYSENQWIQLEHFDNPNHYGVKVFQADLGFDLEKKLKEFASETGLFRVMGPNFIKELKQGHQVRLAARHPSDQPVFIEASPGTGGILIRDLKQNIIGIDQLFLGEKKAKEKENTNQKDILKNKDQDNQQDQSFGIGS